MVPRIEVAAQVRISHDLERRITECVGSVRPRARKRPLPWPEPMQGHRHPLPVLLKSGMKANAPQIPQSDSQAGSNDHLVGIVQEVTQLPALQPALHRIWKLPGWHEGTLIREDLRICDVWGNAGGRHLVLETRFIIRCGKLLVKPVEKRQLSMKVVNVSLRKRPLLQT